MVAFSHTPPGPDMREVIVRLEDKQKTRTSESLSAFMKMPDVPQSAQRTPSEKLKVKGFFSAISASSAVRKPLWRVHNNSSVYISVKGIDFLSKSDYMIPAIEARAKFSTSVG